MSGRVTGEIEFLILFWLFREDIAFLTANLYCSGGLQARVGVHMPKGPEGKL